MVRLFVALGLLLAWPLVGGWRVSPRDESTVAPSLVAEPRPTPLAVERRHRYMVNARVRPLLLFWIGRRNIGSAQFTWRRREPAERGFEVLIGSDPERAPRRINRWGYIAQDTDGTTTTIVGLMTDSSEQSFDEAEAKVARERDDGRSFRAIQMAIAGPEVVSTSSHVHVSGDWTYRDLERVLARIPAEPRTARKLSIAADVDRGFLSAMSGLMERSVTTCATGERSRPPAGVQYVYNVTLFRLWFESCEPERHVLVDGGTIPAIDARFALQNLSTKNVTRFRVVYGADGEWTAVPTRVVFRPQWWIEVELALDDEVQW